MENEEVTYGSIKASGSELSYAKFGHGKDYFVLLPGLHSKSLMPFAPAVAKQYGKLLDSFTIYMFDRISNPPESYSIRDMAKDTISAIEELKIKDAYVLGVSMGGMIAQTIAVERGDLVKKLAVCSTTPRMNENSLNVFGQWKRLAQANQQKELAQMLGKTIYTQDFYESYKDAIMESFAGASESEIRRFIICTQAILNFDISSELEKIKAPVFVVAGAQDLIFTSELADEIAEKTGGEKYIYPNYGHSAYDEAPDFLDRVWNFFKPTTSSF
ncbi:esterase [Treponema sp. JC4]|uniref:alpha/beta fold hydrolase n=1 Tax=Treponema sp. JC4 TaxID=1124982 RepID=UPI00025B09F2|nr:alpha/beta hydrolase [Treponema sp. JC4]EID85917.1 esterase [Treponema sp. JC4]